MTTQQTPTRRLADFIVPGGLDAYVAQHRGRGDSWQRIARDLYLDTDGELDITFQTLASWFAAAESEQAS